MIYVDDREPDRIVKILGSIGVIAEKRRLDVSDYLIVNKSYEVAIERKEINDFVNSIVDGRIFRQAHKLTSRYPLSFIFIIGDIKDILEIRDIGVEPLIGAIISITIRNELGQIIPLFFRDEYEMCLAMKYIERKLIKGELKIVPRISYREDYEIAMLMAIPGIGEEKAKRLIKHFKNLRNIANASITELMRVNGIGEKQAKRIYNIFRGYRLS